MKISYAILYNGELGRIFGLLSALVAAGRPEQNELVILRSPESLKGKNTLGSFSVYAEVFKSVTFKTSDILNARFWARRNELNTLCRGEWIFQLDPDEMPTIGLLDFVNNIQDKDVDAYAIARENVVEGITTEYLRKQGWTMDSRSRINWPDYQIRLYQNRPDIQWGAGPHGTINKVKNLHKIDPTGKFLIHYKTFECQKDQNDFYASITG